MNEEIKPENLRIHSRADELIACLEGEIAKRDEELAACRIAVENCEVFRARIAELEADRDSHQCYVMLTNLLARIHRDGGQYMKQHGMDKAFADADAIVAELYAAPVSEAKAQGVVMPEQIQRALDFSRNFADSKPDIGISERLHILGLANLLEKEASLKAAPVQQVSVPDGPAKMQWPEIVALVNEVLGCEAHKYPCERGSIGHEMTGINFNSLARIIDRVHRLKAAPVQQPKCKTCDDNGRIGGPSFYAPDEGGEPCPDCSAPVQQVSVPDEMRSLAQRMREYNQNPHHINPMSEAFHILVADAANALSAACVPKEIAAAITWSEHLLFECGALTSTRAPSVHVYNKTFAAVQAAKAMLAAAPAAPAVDAGVNDHD